MAKRGLKKLMQGFFDNFSSQLINKLTNVNAFLEKRRKRFDWLIIILYVILLIIVISFHEPWYDEIQAWLIAKSANLWKIIFEIPHYEGHPPLWHLILHPFASVDFPFELTLKTVNVIICTAAVTILVKKSPFPAWVRYTLPFTYFFFYQYGVIARPYGLMWLGFLLAANFYKERNNHPWRFVLSLILICCCSAYGIVLAGGITLVWLKEIITKKRIKGLIGDKKIMTPLITLAVGAIFLIGLIMPRSNTIIMTDETFGDTNIAQRLVYTFFVAPMDATFYTSFNNYLFLRGGVISGNFNMIVATLMFFPIALFLYCIAKTYKQTNLLLIPYLLLSFFAAAVYFTAHHLGIYTMFLIFWLWVLIDKKQTITIKTKSSKVLFFNQEWNELLNILAAGVIIMSITNTFCAVISEIKMNYGYEKEMANFIMDNHLQNKKLMADWNILRVNDITEQSPEISGRVMLRAYMPQPFYNLQGREYIYHKNLTETEKDILFAQWRSEGAPDFLFGNCQLEAVFGKEVTMNDYIPIKEIWTARIWETKAFGSPIYIYMRKDLADEYPQFQEIEINKTLLRTDSFFDYLDS